jgi:hypothetical protein
MENKKPKTGAMAFCRTCKQKRHFHWKPVEERQKIIEGWKNELENKQKSLAENKQIISEEDLFGNRFEVDITPKMNSTIAPDAFPLNKFFCCDVCQSDDLELEYIDSQEAVKRNKARDQERGNK